MRRFSRFLSLSGVLLAAAALFPCTASAQQLDSTLLSAFRWRSIGPANMGGRITDIEGIASPSKTFYVAAAAGGVWKTTKTTATAVLAKLMTVTVQNLSAPVRRNAFQLACRIAANSANPMTGALIAEHAPQQ